MTKLKYSSKRERFINSAEKRTSRVLNNIRVLSNCSNKWLYEYGDEDVEKIVKAIEAEVLKLKIRFNPKRQLFKLFIQDNK